MYVPWWLVWNGLELNTMKLFEKYIHQQLSWFNWFKICQKGQFINLAFKSAETHLVVYKITSGVVILNNCYTISLVFTCFISIITCQYLRFEYSILIMVLIVTNTWLILDTCRVTRYLGKVNLLEIRICNPNICTYSLYN